MTVITQGYLGLLVITQGYGSGVAPPPAVNEVTLIAPAIVRTLAAEALARTLRAPAIVRTLTAQDPE